MFMLPQAPGRDHRRSTPPYVAADLTSALFLELVSDRPAAPVMEGDAPRPVQLCAQRQPRPLQHGVVAQENADRLIDPDHVAAERAVQLIYTHNDVSSIGRRTK